MVRRGVYAAVMRLRRNPARPWEVRTLRPLDFERLSALPPARLSSATPLPTVVKGDGMGRFTLVLAATTALVATFALAGSAADQGYRVRNCSQGARICTEVANSIGYNGAYTGHDEPALLFYSNTPGSGNSNNVHGSRCRPTRRSCRTRTGPARPGTSSSTRLLARDGDVRQPVGAGVHARPRARPTATRTSRTEPIPPRPTTSASTPGRRSWRCSSTRRAGSPGPPASAATRRSGARR